MKPFCILQASKNFSGLGRSDGLAETSSQ